MNSKVFDLPIKNFKNTEMSIDTLYTGAVFGGYFLLDLWKSSLEEELNSNDVNAYSVFIRNSEVEIYQIHKKCFEKISHFERVIIKFLDLF